MSAPYRFTRKGRRPVTLAAFFFTLAFAGFALANHAPLLFWLPVGLALAMLTWAVVLNPVHGMELTDTEWRITAPRPMRIALVDIDRVEITEDSEGPDDVRVVLASGHHVDIPFLALPRSAILAAELRQRGVRVAL
ncbi:MAG: hypothetical protein ACPGID_08540 [Rubricella sp.]